MNSVNIYVEANPNPNSLKFVTDRMLLQNNEIKDYPNPKSAIESPIALALFEFKYIERVFIMSNFITITKNDLVDWEEVKLELRNFIKKFIEEDGKIINPQSSNKTLKSGIEKLLKRFIPEVNEVVAEGV